MMFRVTKCEHGIDMCQQQCLICTKDRLIEELEARLYRKDKRVKTWKRLCDELEAENEKLRAVVKAVSEVNAEIWAEDAGGYDPAWSDVEDALAALQETDDE